MAEQVRLGIVGLGAQGSTYARLITDGMVPNMKIGAICTSNPAKAEVVGSTYPGVGFYVDYSTMLGSGDLDAVVICVPPYLHPEMAITALERDIHALVEKPAGVYTKQVRELNAYAVTKPGLTFAIMFNQRNNPLYQRIKEIIEGGELGNIRRSVHDLIGTDRFEILGDSGKIVVDNSRTATVIRLSRPEREIGDQMSSDDVERLYAGRLDIGAFSASEVIEFDSAWGSQHAGVLQNFAANILDGTPLIARPVRTASKGCSWPMPSTSPAGPAMRCRSTSTMTSTSVSSTSASAKKASSRRGGNHRACAFWEDQ